MSDTLEQAVKDDYDDKSIGDNHVGGFMPVIERESPGQFRPAMPVPMFSPSSTGTAVSHEPTPAHETPPAIDLRSISPHADPDTKKCIDRELQESNPFAVPRKHEQVLINRRHERYDVPPFNTSDFPHRVCPPGHAQADPWKAGEWCDMVHPDGSLYFHKDFRGSTGTCSFFTEAYLYSAEMLKEVTSFAIYIWQHVGGKISYEDLEVVINVKVDADCNRVIWSYYFIDHVRRMPFWMRPYNPADSMRTTESLGASSPDHFQYLLRAMYWEHCSLFPRHSRGIRTIPDDVYARLTTELSWCAAESVISPFRYTAPYTAEEAIQLREQIDYTRKHKEELEHHTEIAGRIMGVLERWRYDFLHGSQVVRRFRGQTVLPPRRQTKLYKFLAPFLFYAPLAHLYDCNSVYLDGVLANEPEWTKHVKKLLAEWNEFVLYATILLNANLAFLSVPNTILFPADGSSTSNTYQHELVSPAAILSCCSMFASIGSIIIGLLLVRQHRGEEIMDNPRTDKDTFMEKRRSQKYGFELVSVLYSLPYALLMWSITTFLAALVTFNLLGTDWPIRATVLAMLIIVIALSVWCIQNGWGTSQNRDFFRYKGGSSSSAPIDRATARTTKDSFTAHVPLKSEDDARRKYMGSYFSSRRGSQTARTKEESAMV